MLNISESILGPNRSIPQTRYIKICLLSVGVVSWPGATQVSLRRLGSIQLPRETCLDKEGSLWSVLLFHPEMGTLSTGHHN